MDQSELMQIAGSRTYAKQLTVDFIADEDKIGLCHQNMINFLVSTLNLTTKNNFRA